MDLVAEYAVPLPMMTPRCARFGVPRDPNPHVALGHGIHFYLGAALARHEARVALGDLLDRMMRIRLARLNIFFAAARARASS
ncbi:MAG: cytochrome [Gemmatimonadetes bacterium]|nr:cytochrome [Gemmatimonadota bacterium]